jgi:hypothetical protein
LRREKRRREEENKWRERGWGDDGKQARRWAQHR